MKKLLLITIVVFMSSLWTISNAQVRGGFKLGADFSNLKWEDNTFGSVNDLLETKRLISPRLGFIIDVGIVHNIFIQAGVYGSVKGFRYDSERVIGGKDYDSKETQILATLDIPINVGYKYDLGGAKIFGMLGPNISYGFYTTALYKADGEYDNDQQTIGTKSTDTYKPLNFGLNFEAGVEFSLFQFSAFYTQGLSNISNLSTDEIKTNVFGLTAAIMFGSAD